jgi:DNA-binding response OmpR family regulator
MMGGQLSHRVLVVDDEQDVLNVVTEMLRVLGFAAYGETSGVKAIELIKKESYDLVILDLVLPEMSGLEILQQLRIINQKTPVLLTAGVDISEANIDLLKYGNSEFLKKPFTIDDINCKLGKYFAKRKPQKLSKVR